MVINEARRGDLEYKEKFVKNQLDKLVVNLEGSDSTTFSKAAGRYDRLAKAIVKMTEKKNELNQHLTAKVGDLFDAEDAVLTRVVETASFAMTLAKEAAKDDKKVINYEKICEELVGLVEKDLLGKVGEIYAKYTELKKGDPPKAALRVKSKVDEALDLGAMVKKAGDFIKSIAKWAVGYDKKLATLKKQAGL